MKKIIAVVLILTTIFCFVGCNNNKGNLSKSSNSKNSNKTSANVKEDTSLDTVDTCEHIWSQWIETIKPTCDLSGKKTRKCVNCLKEESQALKKLSHQESEWIIDQVATVEKEGYKYTKCLYCNKKIKSEVIAKIKADHVHSGVEWIITKPADCTTAGSRNHICSCGANLKTETIPAKGHSKVIDKAISATCTSNGLSEGSHCSICNTIITEQTVIQTTGHSMTSKKVAATSEEAGYILYYCTVCSYSYKEKIVIYDANGIAYTEDENGDLWVSGIGTCTSNDIVFPSYVDNKAVIGIRRFAFSGNFNIRTVTFNKGITVIGDSAFANCIKIKTICFPSTLKRIEDHSFYNCRFESIVLPDGLEYIGARPFVVEGGKIVIPDSVKTIESHAFTTSGIEEVVIPGNVELGTSVFKDCNELKKVTIKDGLKKIPNQTFMGCDKLQEINLPKSIASYGNSAFAGCNKLRISHLSLYNVNVIGTNVFSGIGIDTVEIYSDVYTDAFSGCRIGNLILHEGVTKIVKSAFSRTIISNIQLPKSLTTVGGHAFYNCRVNDIVFNGPVSLGHSAFKGSTIKTIVLPKNSTVGAYVFCDCKNLQTITFGGTKSEWKEMIRINNYGESASHFKEVYAAEVICSDGVMEPNDYYYVRN